MKDIRGLLIIVILNEVKNLYPRFTDIRDVSATLNMTFLEHPLNERLSIHLWAKRNFFNFFLFPDAV
jgi:hypothetical protein